MWKILVRLNSWIPLFSFIVGAWDRKVKEATARARWNSDGGGALLSSCSLLE
jgi:hypothetical protein